MINMCSSEWNRVIERDCSEKVLFLFVFLFKLFIQDVEEVRFFLFYHYFATLPQKKSPCTIRSKERGSPALSGDRIAQTWTDDAQAGFVYFFFFLIIQREMRFRIKIPAKVRPPRCPRVRKNRQFSSRLRAFAAPTPKWILFLLVTASRQVIW